MDAKPEVDELKNKCLEADHTVGLYVLAQSYVTF